MAIIPDLWPESIGRVNSGPEVVNPLEILTAQAQQLRQKTNGTVEAWVVRSSASPSAKSDDISFAYDFVISAPALDGFRRRLFTVEFPPAFYPACLQSGADTEAVKATDAKDFLDKLRDLLSHSSTRGLIESLLKQSEVLRPF